MRTSLIGVVLGVAMVGAFTVGAGAARADGFPENTISYNCSLTASNGDQSAQYNCSPTNTNAGSGSTQQHVKGTNYAGKIYQGFSFYSGNIPACGGSPALWFGTIFLYRNGSQYTSTTYFNGLSTGSYQWKAWYHYKAYTVGTTGAFSGRSSEMYLRGTCGAIISNHNFSTGRYTLRTY